MLIEIISINAILIKSFITIINLYFIIINFRVTQIIFSIIKNITRNRNEKRIIVIIILLR